MKFDPKNYLIDLPQKEGEDPKKYLEVKWRMFWFRQEHPNGLVKIEIIKCDQVSAVAKAEVYLDKTDEAPIAVNFGSANRETSGEFKFVECAATYAKGRALSDAGYNVFDKDIVDEDGTLSVADSPITATPLPSRADVKTAEIKTVRDPANSAASKEVNNTSMPSIGEFVDASDDCPFVKEDINNPVEEAKKQVIPFGNYQGNTLEFIYNLANKDEMLDWFISQAEVLDEKFVNACKLLRNS